MSRTKTSPHSYRRARSLRRVLLHVYTFGQSPLPCPALPCRTAKSYIHFSPRPRVSSAPFTELEILQSRVRRWDLSPFPCGIGHNPRLACRFASRAPSRGLVAGRGDVKSLILPPLLHRSSGIPAPPVQDDPLVAVELLQMFEFNVTATFPAAPLLTVILALVGKSNVPRRRQALSFSSLADDNGSD